MMKVAVINAPNENFAVVEKPIPEPEAGQVRVKVLACGLCHSDAFVKFGLFPGIQYPRSPGHEVAGIVDAVGANVINWKVGANVGVGWHGGHCFTCDRCRRGDFITCASEKICGISYDGGYQQYMIAPAEAVVAMPEGMTHQEAAPLLCAGITVYNGMRNVKDAQAGDIVAVQGIGGLGHLAIQFARKMGFYTIALSRGDDKKELALKLGAHEYLDTATEDGLKSLKSRGGAKMIVATAPSGKAISSVVSALAIDGTLLSIAAAGDNIEAAPLELIGKRRMIKGWPSGTAPDSEDTLMFSQNFDVKPMIETFPLEQVNEAFEKMMTNKARFRVVLTMGH
eukprot:TRINITY_DN24879_c0_g1_i16.p1 TRINITY_DN24879_c0_g1~~TRINITY_DN24879_c0_g1_i16.p1  ORF type:complete len:362 (-),score=91.11 TRINITY_DN24879_c0_g1_i16:758-1774(-)